MVDIDVDVADSLMLLKQLQDGQHAVIHVAKARSLGALGVVETTRPVDGVVETALIDERGPQHGTGGVQLAEIVEFGVCGTGTVSIEPEAREVGGVKTEILVVDVLEQVDVLIGVELHELVVLQLEVVGVVVLHFGFHPVDVYQFIGYFHPERTHWVSCVEGVKSYFIVEEISDPLISDFWLHCQIYTYTRSKSDISSNRFGFFWI